MTPNRRRKTREMSIRICEPSDPVMSDSTYGQRWIIYCSCGTTIFGNTEDEVRATYQLHKEGRI